MSNKKKSDARKKFDAMTDEQKFEYLTKIKEQYKPLFDDLPIWRIKKI